ncbi:MAG TPA: hypothetical protein ENH94_00305 [Phycisphaerales bacterium]|nr:hypothetical protein [Phycisphaerales bacterium]
MDNMDFEEQWGYWVWCESTDQLRQSILAVLDHMELCIPTERRQHVTIIHRKPGCDPLIHDNSQISVGWKYAPPGTKSIEGTIPPEGVLTQLSLKTKRL